MLIFLKLGGSLITDKAAPQTARPAVLARLSREIAQALAEQPGLRLLLGHGSGSFGHSEAAQYGTRQGVQTPEGWRGFSRVGTVAARLNRLVADALLEAGVPVLSLQPSASARCNDGAIESLALEPIQAALDKGLTPLVHGDVAFDAVRGGTIISTEDIFGWLARRLRPSRILLAGLEEGVYADWPAGRTVIRELTPALAHRHLAAVGDSAAPDVTGGMAAKVNEALTLARDVPGLETLIFSGEVEGNVEEALGAERVKFGTRIGRNA